MSSQANNNLAAEAVDYNPFAGASIARAVPTTEAQREIWLADKLGSDASLAYNESISLRLRGKLDLQALTGAVGDVVNAHEALRSTFSSDGQEMLVAESLDVAVDVIDLRSADAGARSRATEQALDRAVRTPFNLEAGPLVRAEVLQLAAEDHLLVFTAHHIVCDGWSFGVIVKDLAAAYSARLGQGDALAAGDSFGEYSLALAREAGSDQQRADEAFWLSKYSGSVPTLDLPVDRARKAWRSFASRRADILFDTELATNIRKWGAKQGASLPATLTTAFALTLSRIAAAPSVVVGMPAAGQAVEGLDRLVGHCVNLLPLRLDIDPNSTVAQAIGNGRTVLLDAYDHQKYTFGTLLQKLAITREPGRLPLVSVLFNVDQPLDESNVNFAGLQFEFHGNPRVAENFEIFVNTVPTQQGLRLEVQYNSDLFDDATIRRWFGAMEALLRAAVADSTLKVGQLPLLSTDAVAELRALQPARTPYEADVLAHEYIERQVDRAPDRKALAFGAEEITYAELEARANRVAHALRGMGVRRGVAVGLCVNRHIDMVVALVGILKSGGTHVPLDPAFPPERIAFMVEDSKLGALITETEHLPKAGTPREKAILLDTAAESLAKQPATRLPRDASSATPDTPAYIIYTSGSTGRPKGVLVPHRAMSNLLTSMRKTPGIETDDVLVAVTTLSFDIAVFELIMPLTVGAKVVVAARDQVRDSGSLRSLLESSKATVMQATPAGWRLLLESGWQGHAKFKSVSGGEPLAPDLAQALLDRCGSVFNGYGPTETTVYSTFWPVTHPERGISIGVPVANTTVWILDENHQALPLGVPGEICIGGDGVTLGYLNRPELTAERFLDNRFDERGGKIYRTGDRGRWLANGTLEHLGRLDFQVKIRGYRVELGEIEANLLANPLVARAVAMAREDRPGDIRLVAYVVAQPGKSVTEDELRKQLSQILPEYFIPQHFVVLPAIPLLPNGKVDRKALPAPNLPTSSREFAPPRNDVEKTLAKAMEEVLGLPGVGIHDDFFRLGGHSLLAAQLTARLNRELSIRLTLRTLFDAPTVAKLAEKVNEQKASGEVAVSAPIERLAEQRTAPLSLMQERLWFLNQLNPDSVVYNTPSGHRLRGAMDYNAFERAFNAMIEHQPSLRTVIGVVDGVPKQIVHDSMPIKLFPAEDLTSIPADRREAELQRRMEEITNAKFDLTQGPLYRVRLYKMGENDHAMAFVPHHIIWDGWSFDIFYAELAGTYEAFLAGKPSPLKALPVSYGDFAAWHRKWLEGPEFGKQISFWREQLKNTGAVTELPVDRPRRPGMSGEGATEWMFIDRAQTEALRELSRAADTTIFMTLLSAYYVLLHRTSGQRSLVVGTPVRGRNLTDVEQVMGYFTNLLPLHLDVNPDESFTDLVKRVKTTVLDSFGCPDVPLEMLMRELTVQRGEGGSLLYQALFSFQDARHRISKWGSMTHERTQLFQRGATEDMGLWLLDDDHGMGGGVTYNADIISKQSARLLCDRYLTIINAVLANPSVRIADLSAALESDGKALSAVNATSATLQGAASVHEMFEAVVDRTPQHPAAFVGGWDTSYADLEHQSNRIAHCLRARGIKPGSVVAICAETGLAFLNSVLAVLKTGGAALVLDPAVATSRVLAAMNVARASALIANSALKDLAAGASVTPLWLDAHGTEIAAASAARVPVPVAPDAAAIHIDLIGLDASPRLVTLTHGSLRNTLLAVRDRIGLQPQHRMLLSGALSSETSVAEWLLPWTVGATSVIVSGESATTRNADSLRNEIEASKATVLSLPTERWESLLSTGWRGNADTLGIVSGSDPSLSLAQMFAEAQGKFWRLHGWAETSIWATCQAIKGSEDALHIGTPLANVGLVALDDLGRLCPVGVFGTLHVTGAGLAGDYLGNTQRTAEAFTNIRLNGSTVRAFRTGERGRLRADGSFELLGEADRVLIGGTRLDLASLTSLVRSQPGIEDAVCVISAGPQQNTRLVAYVATSTDARGELRRLLTERLPPVALPAEAVVLPQLPRLPSGRVDSRMLPAPDDHTQQPANAFVAPQTPTEEMLAGIWRDLLGLPRISARDNFFDLGGHSLLAMQAITQMEQKTGKQIAARRYMFQTLAQLAASYDETTVAAPQKTGFMGRLFGKLKGK